MKVVIHCEPQIKWQSPFAEKLRSGLKILGIANELTSSRERQSDAPAILLGTSCWRRVEASGKYLLVDRCSFGDTNKYVSLVWNGHGRRGDHNVPLFPSGDRWLKHGVPVQPWERERKGGIVLLCAQTEPYSPRFDLMSDWYAMHPEATHIRLHPAQPINPTMLPEATTFENVARAITLNSSVAVETILRGIPTQVDDEGGMAWPGFVRGVDRLRWLEHLAWTQWEHSEIEAGEPIRHLFYN